MNDFSNFKLNFFYIYGDFPASVTCFTCSAYCRAAPQIPISHKVSNDGQQKKGFAAENIPNSKNNGFTR